MPRISEDELILPALREMNKSPNQTITTTNLIKALQNTLNPTDRDNEVISGRNDTYFSQKVRNLKSHDALSKLGYAEYIPKEQGEPSGSFVLTQTGKDYLDTNA